MHLPLLSVISEESPSSLRSLVLEGWVPERCPLNSRDPALCEQCVIPGTGRSCTSPRHRAEPCGRKGEPEEAGTCSGHDFCSRKADTFECSALPCILRQLKHACGCYRGGSLHWGWLKVFVTESLSAVFIQDFSSCTLEIAFTGFWRIW